MSSQEEDPNDTASQNAKKRRIQRACDACRRKKIRCDGAQLPVSKCPNCITHNDECTYAVRVYKKRGSPRGYMENLKSRVEKVEGLLKKFCPDVDFSQELGGPFDSETWITETRAGGDKVSQPEIPRDAGPSMGTHPPVHLTHPEDLESSDDEVVAYHTLLNSMQVERTPAAVRFFGKSSSIMFVQTAMNLKREHSGMPPSERREVPAPPPFESARRKEFRSLHPWLAAQLQGLQRPHKHKQSDFPEESFMFQLIDLYFREVQPFTPLLHRPTFERKIREGIHLEDVGFGSTVLLVCAIGARYTDDPRAYLPNRPDNRFSSGWEWFKQVQMIRQSMFRPPRLYDLQVYCLTAIFLQGSTAPQASWTLIGVGIRMAQDVGAHRKKVYNAKPTVEEELWKRAFWVLVSMDRSLSAVLGRPCAIQDGDFDLDLPIECDDEYWENDDPELAFKQPPGKPSLVTSFNCFLRLNQILAFALRTIYSINKSKALLGHFGPQWEQHTVAEIDSALNKWVDSVPDHLRWDPNREDLIFLNQSATLYVAYYQLQISVHRPFIPSPRKPSPLSFPSLAICTNAARSCTHVLDVQCRRAGSPLGHNQAAIFTCGVLLLLNIWGGKGSGLATDAQKEMTDVHKCMKMLKMLEPQWHTAARLWDILYELAYAGDLPLPQSAPPNNKRDRDSDNPRSETSPGASGSTAAAANVTPSCSDPIYRIDAGSGRVSRDTMNVTAAALNQQEQQSEASITQTSVLTPSDVPSPMDVADAAIASTATNTFALPIHSDELGRLPLHDFPMPNMVTNAGPEPSALNNSWFDLDAGESGLSTMTVPADAGPPSLSADMSRGFDAAGLVSMFGIDINVGGSSGGLDDPRQVYENLFANMPATYPGAQEFPGVMSSTDIPGQSSAQDFADADNTLAMWSSALSDFQWDDWGMYISVMNNPPVQEQSPP